MSSTQQGTTVILATMAVCLLVYVMKQEIQGPRSYPRVEGVVGAVNSALGISRGIDCSKINPGHSDWARCAEGASKGRVPTKNPTSVLRNTALDFASDSVNNQGLGVGRLQDEFVNDQYSNSLGAPRPGGMRIDKSNLKNNFVFSSGTQNATSLVTSGISTDGAQAFPFATKSGPERGEDFRSKRMSGDVTGTEPVGMGMKFADCKRKVGGVTTKHGGIGGFASRAQVDKKLGVAPFDEQGAEFNPFVGNTSTALGVGLKLSEAYDVPNLGMGSNLQQAFRDRGLGAAMSPISSSDVGVSPVEISAATAALSDVNIVQSKPGGHMDRFICP
ncbi:unnamed protein product [Sphacelaria rigidula]